MHERVAGYPPPRLPIFDRVVFFDWYGTLSMSRYWQTPRGHTRVFAELQRRVGELFGQAGRKLVADWMVGRISSQNIVEHLDVDLPSNYRDDFILRGLLDDCRRAEVTTEMRRVLKLTLDKAFVFVATDNMDCFEAATPDELSSLGVDGVLVSSTIGTTKARDPERFFASTLSGLQLSFGDALLIDDCRRTCEAFEEIGGSAHHFTDAEAAASAVTGFLSGIGLRSARPLAQV